MNYSDGKAIHDKLDAIIAGMGRIEADRTEVVSLRARVAELEANIAGAVDVSDAAEAKGRAGLPSAQT